MKQLYFIYGNQPFEIEEEVNDLIQKLLPPENQTDSVFTFDSEDFLSKDQNQNRNLLGDFKNTCETVSFFSPVILVYLRNLQCLSAKSQPKTPLAKELEKIVLIRKDAAGELKWVDADTMLNPPKTQLKLTGKQLVKSVRLIKAGHYAVELDAEWRSRGILRQKGEEYQEVPLREFLSQKLMVELDFEEETSGVPAVSSDDFFSLICQYLNNPPPQVELVFSADIKNTREINREIFSLLKKNAKIIKKTISYDDFRPVQWVIARARKKNVQMDAITADLLIEIAGSDYSVLNMELDKLSVLLPDNQPATSEVVLSSVSHSKNFTVFRITDSLLKKDLRRSLECLESVLGMQSSEIISVFALIASQFRRALNISWMQKQGFPEQVILDHLGLNPWIARQLLKQVESFTSDELENLVIYLSKCDIQLKYSAKDARTLLENICFLICQHEFRAVKTVESKWLP